MDSTLLRIGPQQECEINPRTGVVGAGSFGVVCKGLHVMVQCLVAIKILFDSRGAKEELEGIRAVFECQPKGPPSLAKLHPPFVEPAAHVEGLHAKLAGRNDEVLVLVSEWIDGKTLSDKVSEVEPRDKPAFLERVATAIIAALAFLDRHKVRHGDVRPSNIMIRAADSSAVLIDYSLTRRYGTAPGFSQSRRPNDFYRGPGDLDGNRLADITADFYSLGIVLIEQIVGRNKVPPPTERAQPVTINAEVLLAEGYSQRFIHILRSLLDPNPQARRRVLAPEPVVVISPPAVASTPRSPWTTLWVPLGAVGAVVLAVILWALVRDHRSPSGDADRPVPAAAADRGISDPTRGRSGFRSVSNDR